VARSVRERTNGYAADCSALSRLAVAIKLDSRVPRPVQLRVVQKLDEVVTDLVAVTEQFKGKRKGE